MNWMSVMVNQMFSSFGFSKTQNFCFLAKAIQIQSNLLPTTQNIYSTIFESLNTSKTRISLKSSMHVSVYKRNFIKISSCTCLNPFSNTWFSTNFRSSKHCHLSMKIKYKLHKTPNNTFIIITQPIKLRLNYFQTQNFKHSSKLKISREYHVFLALINMIRPMHVDFQLHRSLKMMLEFIPFSKVIGLWRST